MPRGFAEPKLSRGVRYRGLIEEREELGVFGEKELQRRVAKHSVGVIRDFGGKRSVVAAKAEDDDFNEQIILAIRIDRNGDQDGIVRALSANNRGSSGFHLLNSCASKFKPSEETWL